MSNWWNDNRQDRDYNRNEDRRGSSLETGRNRSEDSDYFTGERNMNPWRDNNSETDFNRSGREMGRDMNRSQGRGGRDMGQDWRETGRDMGRAFSSDRGFDRDRWGSSSQVSGAGAGFGGYGQSSGYQSGPEASSYGGRDWPTFNQGSDANYGGMESGYRGQSQDRSYMSGTGRGSSYGNTNAASYGSTQVNRGANYGMGGDLSATAGGLSNRITHAGRGPKGYQRSDDRIKEDVCEMLARHPDIDASEIEIDVKDGIVHLRGHVDERRTKRLAEDAVENLSGVRDVRNELTVNKSLFERAKEVLTGESSSDAGASSTSTTASTSTAKSSKH